MVRNDSKKNQLTETYICEQEGDQMTQTIEQLRLLIV